MGKVRLYADPSAEGRVGIPKDGELYEAEDAARLVGQGIAKRASPKRKHKSKPAPPPAQEG